MKIGSKLQYEVPNSCPDNCTNLGTRLYQGSICTRCPIFNCAGEVLMKSIEYRDDCAKEWQTFFINLDDLK